MKNIIFIAIFLLSIETASSRSYNFELYGCYTQTTPLYDEVKNVSYSISNSDKRIDWSNKNSRMKVLQQSSTANPTGVFCIDVTSLHATSSLKERFTYNVMVSNSTEGGSWPIVFKQGPTPHTWYMRIDSDDYSGLCISELTRDYQDSNKKYQNQNNCNKTLTLDMNTKANYSIMLQYNPNAT